MTKDLSDLKGRLVEFDNSIAREVSKDVDKMFYKVIVSTLVYWYNDYIPKVYRRTYNFKNNVPKSARTYYFKNTIVFAVNSDAMVQDWDQERYPQAYVIPTESVFEDAFISGIHGNPGIHVTIPTPYDTITDYLNSGFNGNINKSIFKAMYKIMK